VGLNFGCDHGGVESEQQQAPEHDTSRGDLAIATVVSTLVNIG
jgi:hypothetical protein